MKGSQEKSVKRENKTEQKYFVYLAESYLKNGMWLQEGNLGLRKLFNKGYRNFTLKAIEDHRDIRR